ncbi:MAG: hypothetical protein LBE31_07210 [Deltaproteobacteria bacterium]|jgi:general secretion pathway protein A|nr:hypothetical protein [Deltaproteobacteria bacterium]
MDFEEFFQLTQRPFKTTPEAKFFFRRQAFDELCQILSGEMGPLPEVLFLKGPEGVGKSTFLRRLPQALRKTVKMAPILNSSLQLREILSGTLNFFGLGFKCPPTAKEESLLGVFQNSVNQFIESGFGLVLAVDDAHCLPEETLGDLLALTRLEPSWTGKTTLMLVGDDAYGWPGTALPSESIVVELPPMDLSETHRYLRHRLKVAGGAREHFSAESVISLQKMAQGLPSKINPLADRAMMSAWAANRKQVSLPDVISAKSGLDKPFTVDQLAASKAAAARRGRVKLRPRTWIPLALCVIIVAGFFLVAWAQKSQPKAAAMIEESAIDIEPTTPVATATPAATNVLPIETGLNLPTPPPALLHLPHNTLALVVDCGRKLGRLWQGGLSGTGLKAEIAAPDFQAPGLYLVGRPRSRNPLVFQYPPDKDLPKAAGEKLWQQVEPFLPQDILPLLVAEGPALARPAPEDLGAQLSMKVTNWTKAQENKAADEMAGLYADNFQYYEPGHKPMSINRRNFKAALDSESRIAGDVSLAVSDPLIMLDPRSPERAWAVFNLKYDSKIRHDMGLRTLIFEKNRSDGRWLIVAELWLKQDALQN